MFDILYMNNLREISFLLYEESVQAGTNSLILVYTPTYDHNNNSLPPRRQYYYNGGIKDIELYVKDGFLKSLVVSHDGFHPQYVYTSFVPNTTVFQSARYINPDSIECSFGIGFTDSQAVIQVTGRAITPPTVELVNKNNPWDDPMDDDETETDDDDYMLLNLNLRF